MSLKLLLQAQDLGNFRQQRHTLRGGCWHKCTPLCYACCYGNLALMEGVLNHVKALPFVEKPGSKSLLHFISEVQNRDVVNYVEKVEVLIECGKLDLNRRSQTGDGPLFFAVRNSNLVTLKALLKADGVRTDEEADGDTPFLFAVRTRREKVVA